MRPQDFAEVVDNTERLLNAAMKLGDVSSLQGDALQQQLNHLKREIEMYANSLHYRFYSNHIDRVSKTRKPRPEVGLTRKVTKIVTWDPEYSDVKA